VPFWLCNASKGGRILTEFSRRDGDMREAEVEGRLVVAGPDAPEVGLS
jgi:hypothetical protein